MNINQNAFVLGALGAFMCPFILPAVPASPLRKLPDKPDSSSQPCNMTHQYGRNIQGYWQSVGNYSKNVTAQYDAGNFAGQE
jgi:hypothetical protein